MDLSEWRRFLRLRHACVLLLGAAACVSSRADELRGAYVGAALHRAAFDLDGTLAAAGFEGSDATLKILGGYRLKRSLAVEAAYFRVDDEAADGASEADVAALTMAAAGIWPVKKVDLYGRAGLSYWRTAIRHGQEPVFHDRLLDPFVGVGVQYQAGKLALRADFDLLPLRVVNWLDGAPKGGGWVETLSVGAVWRLR